MVAKILAVDDDPNILQLLKLRLQKNGFTVLCAADGEEALRIAKQEIPDLIVLDIMLPGSLDGTQVSEILKEDPKTQNIPIIFLSALKGDQQEKISFETASPLGYETAPASGPSVIFGKPFDPEVLVKKMRDLIELSRKRSK